MKIQFCFFVLAVTVMGSCIDNNQNQIDPGPKPVVLKKNPKCQISAIQEADMTTATIRGVCTGQAHLWGGGATVDNQPVFYVNSTGKPPLNVQLSCPFTFKVTFKTPPQSVDWKYVLMLEAEDIPGVEPCKEKLN